MDEIVLKSRKQLEIDMENYLINLCNKCETFDDIKKAYSEISSGMVHFNLHGLLEKYELLIDQKLHKLMESGNPDIVYYAFQRGSNHYDKVIEHVIANIDKYKDYNVMIETLVEYNWIYFLDDKKKFKKSEYSNRITKGLENIDKLCDVLPNLYKYMRKVKDTNYKNIFNPNILYLALKLCTKWDALFIDIVEPIKSYLISNIRYFDDPDIMDYYYFYNDHKINWHNKLNGNIDSDDESE